MNEAANSLDLSIIIPTYNRDIHCAALVSRLLADLPDKTEIIVVAQIGAVSLPADRRVRSTVLPVASLTRARNTGIGLARGAVILFLDDDCIPAPHLAETHIALHHEHAAVSVIAGMVHDRHNRGDKERIVILDETTLTLQTDYALSREEEVPCGPGGHLSIKRNVFLDLLFDPWFRGNAQCEEIDFALRLRRRGGRILFSPRASMVHAIEETGGCRQERTRNRFYRTRFYNHGLCFAKNCRLRYTGRFFIAQKRQIEYYSRLGAGHRLDTAAAALYGTISGWMAGVVRRKVGDARYR